MKIKKIRKTDRLEHTYDIEVLNDHNYLLDNGVVSHNSSLVSNSTNGFEPIRDLITIKQSKAGYPLPLVVPEMNKLKNKYSYAFKVTNDDMNNVVNVAQKYFDQGISVNHYYNKNNFENGEVPLSSIVLDILNFYKFGGKQLYYANSLDNSIKMESDNTEEKVEIEESYDDCESGACAI